MTLSDLKRRLDGIVHELAHGEFSDLLQPANRLITDATRRSAKDIAERTAGLLADVERDGVRPDPTSDTVMELVRRALGEL